MWEIIEHVCVSIAVVGAAGTYVYKVFMGIKTPKDEIDKKLQRDYDRINNLEAEITALKKSIDELKDSIKLLIDNDLVMLEHMRTNNSSGAIQEQEHKVKEYLKKRI